MRQDDPDLPARLRFSIIEPLLRSPPEPGELADRIAELARTKWHHPLTGEVMRVSAKTIERWYYAARKVDDPLRALRRKVPKHAGTHPRISAVIAQAIELQYREHPSWSYRRHHGNLVALSRTCPALDPVPSYATVRRYMKEKGLVRRTRRLHGEHRDPGAG